MLDIDCQLWTGYRRAVAKKPRSQSPHLSAVDDAETTHVSDTLQVFAVKDRIRLGDTTPPILVPTAAVITTEIDGMKVTFQAGSDGGTIDVSGVSLNDVSPARLRKVAAAMDVAVMTAFAAVSDVEPRTLWDAHLRGVVPVRKGETKPQWMARVWREYYEPTGRTMKELAEHTGLSHGSVRTYCSEFDPTKKGTK